MGGNALKTVKTQRKSAEEYHTLVPEILERLQEFYERSAVIPAYGSKESFGDCDIVVTKQKDPSLSKEEIAKKAFSPQETFDNGNCLSLDFQNLQIDIISSSEELFDCTLSYYSFNDLGNLIGRVAHSMGLKYGYQGLMYPVFLEQSKKETYLQSITLSTNSKENLEFLGYNFSRWEKGFKDLEEIFEYTASSIYFNPAFFDLKNIDHANRKRNAVRPTYNQFTNWLEDPENSSKISRCNYEDKPTHRKNHRERALNVFPKSNPRQRIQEILQEVQRAQDASKKFNGEIINKITGLTKKDLGSFIQSLKNGIGDKKEVQDWALKSSSLQIEQKIRKEFKQWKTQQIPSPN